MNQIRIGILGAGDNTRRKHIPLLQAIDGVRIDAVCNRSLESSKRVCDAFDIPNAVTDPDQILQSPDLDAVVIGTWPYMHCPFTVAALENGKHVMCEARMAMNADEARTMLEAAQAHPNLVAQIVPAPFSLHYDDLVRDLVDQRLGRLISVRVRLNQAGFPQRPTEKTWRRNSAYSGNNVMSVGIHYEMLMRWVGPVARVHAQCRTVVDEGVNPETGNVEPIDIPDHVTAIGTMRRDEAAFEMVASAVSGFDRGTEFWITGEDATLHIAGNRIAIGGRDDEAITPVPVDAKPGSGWRVEEEFIDAIRGGEPIRRTDLATGLKYMQFTDALHESSRRGQLVDVDSM